MSAILISSNDVINKEATDREELSKFNIFIMQVLNNRPIGKLKPNPEMEFNMRQILYL